MAFRRKVNKNIKTEDTDRDSLPSVQKSKLVITIVDRGFGQKMMDLYSRRHIVCHCQCAGHGTAASDIMDVFGLGITEQDIIFSLGTKKDVESFLYELKNDLRSYIESKGVVMSIPLTGIGNMIGSFISGVSGNVEDNRKEVRELDKNSSLLVITVNQGYTDEVMSAAKAAGAMGGTILRARWSDSDMIKNFYGFAMQQEKEVNMILAGNDIRNQIMEAVNSAYGLKTEAQAFVYSLAVDRAFKLS